MSHKTFIKNNHIEFREVIKELDLYEKAVLLGMLNYIEYRSNCVVVGGKHCITVEEISGLAGISERKTYDVLRTLMKKHLIAKANVGERNRFQYYMNPWIAVRGNLINATLKEMFAEYPIRTKGMTKWKDL